MKKKVIIIISAVVLLCAIAAVLWFAVPAVRNTVKGWFAAPQEEVVPPVQPEEIVIDIEEVTKHVDEYKAALIAKPEDVETSVKLITAYGALGDMQAARAEMTRIAGLVPTDTRIYDAMYDAYERAGDYRSAAIMIDELPAIVKKQYEEKLRKEGNPLYAGFGNTPGNLANSGYVCVTDDAIYYSERMDGKALYRCDLDGNNKKKLSDLPARDINVVGDTVYFVEEQLYTINSVKTDGSDEKRIIETIGKTLTVFGNRLYFVNWGENCKIYSANFDGTDVKMEYDICAADYIFYGAWIYYSDHNMGDTMSRIRIDGTQNTDMNDVQSVFTIAADGYVYFVNWGDGGKVYRYSHDLTEAEIIACPRKSGHLNIHGDYLYYVDWVNNGNIYRVHLETGVAESLTKDTCSYIFLDDEYIYYNNSGDGKRLYRMKHDGSDKMLIGK